MNEYINKSDALDILDQFEDAIENGERGFYSQARKMMCDLPTEKIIHCKDCKYYCNVLSRNTQFEYGECSAVDEFYIKDIKPDDFCSMAIEKKIMNDEFKLGDRVFFTDKHGIGIFGDVISMDNDKQIMLVTTDDKRVYKIHGDNVIRLR